MPTFENLTAEADEHQTALRALMHATHSINDPREMGLLHVLESNRALHRRREVVQRAAGRGDRC